MKTKCIWLTGLSGSGKTTLARRLKEKYPDFYIIDGDEIRKGFCKDLGFDYNSRKENMNRIRVLCHTFIMAGVPVIVSCISPFESDRMQAKHEIDGCKIVYLSTPIEVCVDRDPKGMYKKALKGEIKNFTGISSGYDIPENPDLIINTEYLTVEESLNELLTIL